MFVIFGLIIIQVSIRRIVSGIGGLIEQNTPFFAVKTLITRLLELDSCKNLHDREQLVLQHVMDEKMKQLLPLLNDLLVLKVLINTSIDPHSCGICSYSFLKRMPLLT